MKTSLALTAAATTANVRLFRRKVAQAAARAGASDDVVDDVRLCVGEAVTNAVVHAYDAAEGVVDVTVDVAGDQLVVVVRDEGKGLREARGEQNGGGFGLRIIARLTRSYLVSSAPHRGTEVRMIFVLGARRPSWSRRA